MGRRSLIAALGVAMLVGIVAMGLEGHRITQTLVATAPARVEVYLQTVEAAPQGAVVCHPAYGVTYTVP